MALTPQTGTAAAPRPELQAAIRLVRTLTPKWSRYIPLKPWPKQQLWCCLDHVEEGFYGGAAAGAKSTALLMSALQYCDQPGYRALLLRRTFQDLAKPGALMDMAHEWLDGTDAHWNGTKNQFRFPEGAVLAFGYMDNERDMYTYQSAQYHFVGWDELTQFQQRPYLYLFSRMRRTVDMKFPIRIRSASNPGGIGHQWVKERFCPTEPWKCPPGRFSIPASVYDNPAINAAEYRSRLMHLHPVDRERLMNGDWEIVEGGSVIDRSWWQTFVDHPPVEIVGRVRFWDLAASVSEDAKETAGVRMSRTTKGLYVVEDVVHGRWRPGERDLVILKSADMDGDSTFQKIEQEPASGGIAQCDALIRMLAGYRVEAVPTGKATGDKFLRAGPFASQVQAGNVALVRAAWNASFIDQLHAADPLKGDKQLLDQMDAASGAFNALAKTTLNPFAIEASQMFGRDPRTLSESERDALFEKERDEERGRRSIFEDPDLLGPQGGFFE